ncbi:MAG: GNAT family N-acetyltransferase [Myxococcota bacterium]
MDTLIQRSEGLEQVAWSDLYQGAPEPLRKGMGLETTRHAGGTLLVAQQADHLLLNRAMGLRPSGDGLDQAVRDAVAHYRSRRIKRFWVQLTSDQRHGPLPRLLAMQDVVRYPRSWMKFVRATTSLREQPTDATLRLATEDDRDAIAGVFRETFDLPQSGARLFASTAGRPDWRVFVAEDPSGIVGAATLFLAGEDGYLAFAGTSRRARRRGIQRALLGTRLELAAMLGCKRVFAETGLPREGEPNSSYRNMLRLGFDELCVRDNFAPEGTTWLSLPSSDADSRSNA